MLLTLFEQPDVKQKTPLGIRAVFGKRAPENTRTVHTDTSVNTLFIQEILVFMPAAEALPTCTPEMF